MAELVLTAPMRGWATPLDEVDDPVFSGRMLGDGVAVDPTGGELRAPCDGVVISVHTAGHAVTLRAENGAELLLHVGLETVGLGGAGFTRRVADGDAVRRGDLLLEVDLDLVARRAKALVTPIVVTNGETFAIAERTLGCRVEIGEPLMVLRPIADGAAAADVQIGANASQIVIVPLAHGLHARPSALVAAEARRFQADVRIESGGRSAGARSPVALMALGLVHGAQATITAQGPDAEEAVTALVALIDHGLPPEPPAAIEPVLAPTAPAAEGVLRGVPAAPGLAIGVAARLTAAEVTPVERSAGPAMENAALDAALAALRARLEAQSRSGPRAQKEIVQAHLAFLGDEELSSAARGAIASGASAGVAWRTAVRAQVAVLRGLADPLIAQRADDLVDLERGVLMELAGEGEARAVLPPGAVIVADDLAPSQLIGLEGQLAGVVTAAGGPTSHVAILAAALDIPAVVAVGPASRSIPDGAGMIVDGGAGTVCVAPDAGEIAAAQTRIAARNMRIARARAEAAEPCRTADGVRIEVFANVGSLADARAAAAAGAEGCGLLRTEFLFFDRAAPPAEDEQFHCYQEIAEALAPSPVVIRTLDVGGDKPVAYFDLPQEENPALGLRGVRVSLARPELLAVQLRAILRVAPAGQCRLLVPMVASLSELRAFRALTQAAARNVGCEAAVQIGVMVETPAAAMTADLLAREADFLSIGTNDLTQYGLAMDRGNPAVAAGVDALHPAILRLIRIAGAGAASSGRPLAVCGGLAADPAAAAILIGLGVTELSVPPGAVAEIKAAVRTLQVPACAALANRATECLGPAEVRALVAHGGAS